MADHNVTIYISADATQLAGGFAQATAMMGSFAAQASAAGAGMGGFANSAGAAASGAASMGSQVGMAGGQMRTFASIAGMASSVLQSFQSQSNIFSSIAAGAKTLATEIATVMPVVLGVRMAMRALQEGAKFMIDSFMNFDKEMTFSEAIMGNLSDTMKNDLATAAMDVARTTTFAADEAAKGLYYIASAGFSAEAAIKVLPIAATFAQAGMLELKDATRDLLTVTVALGLVSKDSFGNINVDPTVAAMQHVADVIVKVSVLSNSTIDEMDQAMSGKAAAAARAMGKSVEEMAATLSAFANVGIRGATASTQLSIMWRELERRAITNKSSFEALGISVFDASGKMFDTGQIVSQMNSRLGSMSDETKKATLMTLGFSDRSVQALMAVMDLGDGMQQTEQVLRAAGGTAKEVADKQLTALSSQFTILRNNIGDFAVIAGGAIVSWARSVGDVLQPLITSVGEFTAAVWGASEPIRQLAGTMAAGFVAPLMASIGPIADIVGNLAKMKLVIDGVAMYALMAAFNKFGALAVPIVNGVSAGLTSLWLNVGLAAKNIDMGFETMAAGAVKFGQAVKTAGTLAVEGLGTIAEAALSPTQAFATLGEVATGTFVSMTTLASAAAESVMVRLQVAAGSIITSFLEMDMSLSGIWVAISAGAASAANSVRESFASVNASIGAVVSQMIGPLMIGVMMMKQGFDSAKRAAEQSAKAFSDNIHVEDMGQEMNKYQAIMDRANAANEKFTQIAGSGFSDSGGAGMQRLVFTAESMSQALTQNDTDLLKVTADMDAANKAALEAGDEYNNYTKGTKDLGVSFAILSQAAKEAGIDLAKGPLTDGDWKALGKSVDLVKGKLAIASGGAVNFKDVTTASMQAIYSDAQKIETGMVDVWTKIMDAANMYKESLVKVQSAQDIFKDSLNDAKTAAQQVLEDQKKAVDDSTQKQVDALESQKQAILDSLSSSARDQGQVLSGKNITNGSLYKQEVSQIKGSTQDKKNAIKDDTTATRQAIEADFKAREAAIKDGSDSQKKVLDRTAKDVNVVPAMEDFLHGLQTQADAVRAQKQGLDELARAGASSETLTFLGQLKPEEFKGMYEGIQADEKGFVDKFNAQLSDLGKLAATPPWEVMKTQFDKAFQDRSDLNNDIINLSLKSGVDPQQIESMVTQISKKGQDPVAFIKETLSRFNQGGAVQQEVKTMLEQWKTINQDTIPKLGENFNNTASLLYAISTGDMKTVDEAMKNLDPQNWNQQLKDMGLDDQMIKQVHDLLKGKIDATTDGLRDGLKKMLDAMDEANKGKPAPTSLLTRFIPPGFHWDDQKQQIVENTDYHKMEGNIAHKNSANGNIFSSYSSGGEDHSAQIAPGSTRIWAEPETGGEAYIPLGASKRGRSVDILHSVASMFGYSLAQAGGSQRALSYNSSSSGISRVTSTSSTMQHITNFNGDIKVPSIADVQSYADRKKRQAALTGGY